MAMFDIDIGDINISIYINNTIDKLNKIYSK